MYKCRTCGKQIAGNGFYLDVKFGKEYDQWHGKRHCGQELMLIYQGMDMQRVQYKDKETNEVRTTRELAFRLPRVRLEKERLAISDIADVVRKGRMRV
jgi:hypothetical protein